MQISPEIVSVIEDEAKDISSKYDYSYDDALDALNRSFKYYTDIGEGEETALEGAQAMVAEAVFTAENKGFESLLDMVNHMVFAVFHRVQ